MASDQIIEIITTYRLKRLTFTLTVRNFYTFKHPYPSSMHENSAQ
jgi:hypothetical protein